MRRAAFITVVLLVSFHFAVAQVPPLKDNKAGDTQTVEVGGRSIEYWIQELHSQDPSKRETAIRMIAAFPPDRAYQAVPDILKELQKHTAVNTVDLSVRVNLCMALGDIFEGVKAPQPSHVSEAVTLLKRALGDQQAILRYRAAEALSKIGPDAKSATDQLIAMTKEFITWETRQMAATALGKIGQDKAGPEQKVTDALFRTLGDKSFQVRLASIRSLAWLGGPSDPRVRAQMKTALELPATKDADPTVQIWAHMAIMSIGGEVDEKRLAVIGNVLKTSKDMGARMQAAQAIGSLGTKGGPQRDSLIAGLADKEVHVVYWCIVALSEQGPSAAKAVPELQKLAANAKLPDFIRKPAEETADLISGKKK